MQSDIERILINLQFEQTRTQNAIMDKNTAGPININIKAIVRERLGGASRLVPGYFVRKLEKLICQERLNELLARNYPMVGADFCRGVLDNLNVSVEAVNIDRLPAVDNRRVIIACNHPLGGLDGMALIDFFTRHYGGNLKFIVNDLLMAVKPLAPVFLPINKHGRQSRESLTAIHQVMSGNDPVLIFPAGLCSRQLVANGEIADLEWKKMFINRAIASRRDIIPLYFDGENSSRFYSFARRREGLGLKFNFEMALLPSEVFKAEGKTFRINCGRLIPWQSLTGGTEAQSEAAYVRRMVYELKKELYND